MELLKKNKTLEVEFVLPVNLDCVTNTDKI